MLYLDLAINKEEMLSDFQNKFPMLFRNIIYWFKKSTGQVFKYKINDKTVVVIPKISNRIFKKLDKIFKLDVTKTVCISDKLSIKKDFVDFLEERNLNILNGRWLFKYLITDVIDYVCKNASLEPETQEITILTEENNFLIYDSIKKLSNKVKNINIITHNIKSFDKLINDIHEENGLIINVTENYRKSAIKSKIILNLNFSQKDFNKIVISKKAIIINFENDINIAHKNFAGINANFYHISLPIKYREEFSRLSDFNTVNLYESIIYKKTSSENIWKEIKNDNIKIECLEDKNGNMIRVSDYLQEKEYA